MQLHVSLIFCRRSVKPGSVTCLNILHRKFGFSTNNLLETGNIYLHGEKSCFFSYFCT